MSVPYRLGCPRRVVVENENGEGLVARCMLGPDHEGPHTSRFRCLDYDTNDDLAAKVGVRQWWPITWWDPSVYDEGGDPGADGASPSR